MKTIRMTIYQINKRLRDRHPDTTNIRHHQGSNHDETHLTTSKMPNTDKAGRITVGYTDDLLAEAK